MSHKTNNNQSNADSNRGTVLITGSAKRIGKAIAIDLARHGWRVAIHYRKSADDAEKLIDEITATGATAKAFSADLKDSDQVAQLINNCRSALGPPTCLINNASEFLHDSISEMTEDVWDTHLAINLKAPIFLARDLARDLPDDAQGNVINIIDQRVWKLTPEFFFLHNFEIRLMDRNPHASPSSSPTRPGKRHWPRPCTQEHSPDRRRFRCRMRQNTTRTRSSKIGNC